MYIGKSKEWACGLPLRGVCFMAIVELLCLLQILTSTRVNMRFITRQITTDIIFKRFMFIIQIKFITIHFVRVW